LGALAIGVVGAAVGAEIISHERDKPERRTRAVNYYDVRRFGRKESENRLPRLTTLAKAAFGRLFRVGAISLSDHVFSRKPALHRS
jgi:hypothetical protein